MTDITANDKAFLYVTKRYWYVKNQYHIADSVAKTLQKQLVYESPEDLPYSKSPGHLRTLMERDNFQHTDELKSICYPDTSFRDLGLDPALIGEYDEIRDRTLTLLAKAKTKRDELYDEMLDLEGDIELYHFGEDIVLNRLSQEK